MSKRGRSFRRLILLAAFAGTCLLAAAAGLLAGALPDAFARLGPADPGHDPAERAFLSGYLLINNERLDQPAGPRREPVEVVVEPGTSAAEVAARLAELDVLDDPTLLQRYLRYRGLDKGIEAGRYVLDGGMTPKEIARQLQSASAQPTALTVPEGWRSEQISDAIDAMDIGITREAFLEAARGRPDGYSFSSELPAEGGLEGFLFPDTYFVDQETGPVELVIAMLDNFEAKVTPDLRRGFDQRGLSLYEAVTLASIVEREAIVAEERPLIASVFLNRLALDMRLDADPTVQYALGRQADGSWWKQGLTRDDLAVDSAYNTYVHPGLPPGPIANPGLASLEAVARPEESAFLYFRAACDGSGRHQFAVTFEEHIANECP